MQNLTDLCDGSNGVSSMLNAAPTYVKVTSP